jgi:hypothetical protein
MVYPQSRSSPFPPFLRPLPRPFFLLASRFPHLRSIAGRLAGGRADEVSGGEMVLGRARLGIGHSSGLRWVLGVLRQPIACV